MKPTYLTLDTRDDRTEIWHLLHKLHPRKRYAFLVRCCEKVKDGLGNGLFPVPSVRRQAEDAMRNEPDNERFTNVVYTDLLMLAAQRNLNMYEVAVELEQLAKGRELSQLARLASA